MNQEFINLLLAEINDTVECDADDMNSLRNKILLLCNEYNIEKKCTDIVKYTGYMPECFKIYMVSKKMSGVAISTLKMYNIRLHHFFERMNKDINEITPNDIRLYLYLYQKERGVRNSTLDSMRSSLHSFFEWCANEGYCKSNPCRNVERIKHHYRLRSPLSDMDLERIRDTEMSLRNKAIIEFIYSTGCRVSECEHVNIKDINFEKKEVTLFGKGSKYRTAYLNARAILAIKRYLETRVDNNEALFVHAYKPYCRLKKCGIEVMFNDIKKKSGLEVDFYPHIVRHTTATNCLNRGMDITEIQKMLGHANINTTMIYAHSSTEELKHQHGKYII